MFRKDHLGLIIWFVLISVPLSILMAQHNLAFKTQDKVFFKDSFKSRNPEAEFTMIHVLGANCGCSKKLSSYVEERGVTAKVDEKFIVVEGHLSNEVALEKLGIEIQHMTPSKLKEKYRIESAPQLIVLDAKGDVRYIGGHKRAEEATYRDQEILGELRLGKAVTPYPVFGCAFGKKLKETLDPFKFKYTAKDSL